MCWVISTGKRSITGPMSATSDINACGPPVDDPISSTFGASMPNARRVNGGRRYGRPAHLSTEMADLLDQVVAEGLGGGRFARAFRLRDVVGGAERQRLEADLGVAAGQRGSHDDDEVALLGE